MQNEKIINVRNKIKIKIIQQIIKELKNEQT